MFNKREAAPKAENSTLYNMIGVFRQVTHFMKRNNFEEALEILDEAMDDYPNEIALAVRYADILSGCNHTPISKRVEGIKECWKMIEDADHSKMEFIPDRDNNAKMFFIATLFCVKNNMHDMAHNFADLGLEYFPDDKGLHRLKAEADQNRFAPRTASGLALSTTGYEPFPLHEPARPSFTVEYRKRRTYNR